MKPKTSIDSLDYVIELLEKGITQQQQNVDEWLGRVEFYEGEGWDDITEQARRILQRSIDELNNLRKHKERLQELKEREISA